MHRKPAETAASKPFRESSITNASLVDIFKCFKASK